MRLPLPMTPYDKEIVLDILFQSQDQLTALAYIKQIKKALSVSLIKAKKILKTLIDEQELSYHYLYGTTYVEKSFFKPVKVSNHFILSPRKLNQELSQQTSYEPGQYSDQQKKNPEVQIIIEPGISFGSGQHPTTILCLKALDYCLYEKELLNLNRLSSAADIGTGSGVLALALCHSGSFLCDAYEIDKVSINEAKKNIESNGLQEKINLVPHSMETRQNQYSIICANLRYPTLKVLSQMIYESLNSDGIVILSGVREWEKEDLISAYEDLGFQLSWQKDKKKWSGFVLVKKV